MKTKLCILCITLAVQMLQGCIVTKTVSVAADTAIGVTKASVKTTGKVIDAVIPDGDKKDEKNSK